MKTCAGHYVDLKRSLERKGLWHLVDLSPSVMADRTQRWLTGAGSCAPQHFCPLVVSLLEVQKKVADLFGPQAETVCPFCEAARGMNNDKIPAAWIDNVTDLMLVTAKVNHLVPMGG